LGRQYATSEQNDAVLVGDRRERLDHLGGWRFATFIVGALSSSVLVLWTTRPGSVRCKPSRVSAGGDPNNTGSARHA
jgi:hypothetical protein